MPPYGMPIFKSAPRQSANNYRIGARFTPDLHGSAGTADESAQAGLPRLKSQPGYITDNMSDRDESEGRMRRRQTGNLSPSTLTTRETKLTRD